MDDRFKKRCDVLRVELKEIDMILGKKMRSKCVLDEPIMEIMRKVKCKEIELSNLEVKISQD